MDTSWDAIIVGGGIMGLLSAYRIVGAGGRVVVVDKRPIGNKSAGSSGLTRSLRSDYQSPLYAHLAQRALRGWRELEKETGEQLIAPVGCLNVARTDPTVASYAVSAAQWLRRDGSRPLVFSGEQAVSQRFPQFRGFSYGVLEREAGLGFPQRAMAVFVATLQASRQCTFLEQTTVLSIACRSAGVSVATSMGRLQARRLIIAAGLGTPDVLARIEGVAYQLQLRADRPQECVYVIPQDSSPYENA